MSQENVDTVRAGAALWNVASNDPDEATWRGAIAAMVAAYHPEAEVDFSRTIPDFPTSGARQAMTEWVESSREAFTAVRIEPVELIDAGDTVLAVMRVAGEGALSGAALEADFFYAFRFSGQQIVAATTYLTRQEAVEAVALER